METIPASVADAARGAVEVLRERGHYQGDYYDREWVAQGADLDHVPVDVCGAINLASGLDVDAPWDDHPHHALARATGEALRDYVPIEPDPALDLPTLIGHWNDDSRRTWADIIAALEGVAAAHDKGESL
ncbi:hypothetical protein GT755_12200 [Herbidospora sp. NEAU-GS84]|uniref:Uncharacterized protein n=1 Tax=Herbidospora solisilvae TaxID=2696284 RepID=A0A7C9JDN8_9ACTN|nr:hypothetical protein [Herbidospora solisilvae]NAS22443.1 hypothetical protein [Herbidospora solisilvae]